MPGHPLCKVPQESLAYTHLCSNHAAKEPTAENTLGHPDTHTVPSLISRHLGQGTFAWAIPDQPTLLLFQFHEPCQDTSVQVPPHPLPISASGILPECLCIKNPRLPLLPVTSVSAVLTGHTLYKEFWDHPGPCPIQL